MKVEIPSVTLVLTNDNPSEPFPVPVSITVDNPFGDKRSPLNDVALTTPLSLH